jgi:hypothetical protein
VDGIPNSKSNDCNRIVSVIPLFIRDPVRPGAIRNPSYPPVVEELKSEGTLRRRCQLRDFCSVPVLLPGGLARIDVTLTTTGRDAGALKGWFERVTKEEAVPTRIPSPELHDVPQTWIVNATQARPGVNSHINPECPLFENLLP